MLRFRLYFISIDFRHRFLLNRLNVLRSFFKLYEVQLFWSLSETFFSLLEILRWFQCRNKPLTRILLLLTSHSVDLDNFLTFFYDKISTSNWLLLNSTYVFQLAEWMLSHIRGELRFSLNTLSYSYALQ